MHRKQVYIALAALPLIIGILLSFFYAYAPDLGLEFESRDGRWYIAGVDPEGPAARFSDLIGKEVVAVAG